MMKMKLLGFVTPPSIYLGCSNRKKSWEEKFTGGGKLFSAVNMKICGRLNFRKHKEIKGSDKYVTLYISLKFDKTGQAGNHIFRVKGKIGKIRKGVDYLFEFQGQNKAAQIQKGKLYHRKCQ